MKQVDLKKGSTSNSQTKKCNRNEFETIFSRIVVFGDPVRKFPETIAERSKYCTETSNLLYRFEDYKNRCLKSTTKNFVGILSYTFKGQMKNFCSKKVGQKTRELIAAAPCINRNSEKISKCMEQLSYSFIAIQKSENHLKMPNLCCLYVKRIGCFTLEGENCENQTPILLEKLRNMTGNFLDSTCGEYNPDTDKCDSVPPLPQISKKLKIKNRYIKNLVDIFESIE